MNTQPEHGVLLLVPTAMELNRLIAAIKHRDPIDGWPVNIMAAEICGFGIAAAAAMTMHHLHAYQPHRVVLAGIAGSLTPQCKVGSAYWFSGVLCDGIGVGEKEAFQSAAALRWNQVERIPDPIGDHIGLLVPSGSERDESPLSLVTGCAASSDAEMARLRLRRAREVVAQVDDESPSLVAAEDMEGFAVALACQVMNVRLSIIRGISNHAGDRDHSHWQIDAAIDAIAYEILKTSSFVR